MIAFLTLANVVMVVIGVNMHAPVWVLAMPAIGTIFGLWLLLRRANEK